MNINVAQQLCEGRGGRGGRGEGEEAGGMMQMSSLNSQVPPSLLFFATQLLKISILQAMEGWVGACEQVVRMGHLNVLGSQLDGGYVCVCECVCVCRGG